jgi:AcrR family transcriptional regulator
VFGERGAHATTVEELLAAAEVSRRTFYQSFRNKEEVLAALYEIACGMVLDAMRQAVASTKKPLDKLERCVDAYLGFNRRDAALMRVLEAEAMRPDSLLEPLRAELLERLGAILEESLGDRRPDPLVIRGLLLALEGVSQRVHAEGAVTEERLERARRAMLRILIAPLAKAGDRVPPLPKK